MRSSPQKIASSTRPRVSDVKKPSTRAFSSSNESSGPIANDAAHSRNGPRR